MKEALNLENHKFRFDILAMRQHLYHLYQELFSPIIKQYQITQLETDILLFLANNPQFDTAAEIVANRKLTKSHVSAAVNQLVQKGFIERVYETGNKKRIHLKLLPPAHPLIEQGRLCQKTFFEILSGGVPKKDLQVTQKVLTQMMTNIKEYKGDS